MTALPQPPVHLLTVAEYVELDETESGYTELLEGRLLMSPSPASRPASGKGVAQWLGFADSGKRVV